MLLLLDENGIVRCMASVECNLHADKVAAGMTVVEAERGGTVGDHYNPDTDVWTPHPENYAKPSADEVREAKIQAEIARAAREQAVAVLTAQGEL